MLIISGKCDPKGKGSKCTFSFWKSVKQRTALTIKMQFFIFFLIAWTAAGLYRSCMGTVGNGKADGWHYCPEHFYAGLTPLLSSPTASSTCSNISHQCHKWLVCCAPKGRCQSFSPLLHCLSLSMLGVRCSSHACCSLCNTPNKTCLSRNTKQRLMIRRVQWGLLQKQILLPL